MKTNLLKAVANALIQQGSGDHARRLSPPSKILEKLSQSPETQSLTTLLKRRIEQHSFLSLNDKELIAWSKNGKYNYFLLDNLRSRRIMSDYNICSLYLGPLIRANLIPPSASTEVLDFAFA